MLQSMEYIHDEMREFVHDIMEWPMYNGRKFISISRHYG